MMARMATPEPERLWSVPEAARHLGVGVRLLRRAIARGELPGYRLGLRAVRVSPPEVGAWVRTRTVAQPRTRCAG